MKYTSAGESVIHRAPILCNIHHSAVPYFLYDVIPISFCTEHSSYCEHFCRPTMRSLSFNADRLPTLSEIFTRTRFLVPAWSTPIAIQSVLHHSCVVYLVHQCTIVVARDWPLETVETLGTDTTVVWYVVCGVMPVAAVSRVLLAGAYRHWHYGGTTISARVPIKRMFYMLPAASLR